MTLSSDRDWSGLDVSKIANGSRIDLRGKCLTLKGFNGVKLRYGFIQSGQPRPQCFRVVNPAKTKQVTVKRIVSA